jgi:hypothetical protein
MSKTHRTLLPKGPSPCNPVTAVCETTLRSVKTWPQKQRATQGSRPSECENFFTVGLIGMLALGLTGILIAQQDSPRPRGSAGADQPPAARAPRQDSCAVGQQSQAHAPRPGTADSRDQRRYASRNPFATDGAPEETGKSHGGTHAQWTRKLTAGSIEMNAKAIACALFNQESGLVERPEPARRPGPAPARTCSRPGRRSPEHLSDSGTDMDIRIGT